MGCGDSKLAVATSNAILRRKKPNAAVGTMKSPPTETTLETFKDCDNGVAISKGQQQQDQDQKAEEANEDVNKDNAGVGVADDVKEIDENIEEDEDDKEIIDKLGENNDVVEEHESAGRLITSEESPRHFFSSRKLDDVGIDEIISEGRSGDYHTPRHGPGNKRNVFFKVDDQERKAVEEEDKELLLAAEETEPAVVWKTLSSEETKALPTVLVKEEKLVKETAEAETDATTTEAKVSIPAASWSPSLAAEEDKKEENGIAEKEEMSLKFKLQAKTSSSNCEIRRQATVIAKYERAEATDFREKEYDFVARDLIYRQQMMEKDRIYAEQRADDKVMLIEKRKLPDIMKNYWKRRQELILEKHGL